MLGWVRGKEVAAEELQRALRHLQWERVINKVGYVSVQRFYLYAERGLTRQRVSVWLYEGHLQIALQETMLFQYAYRQDRSGRRISGVDQPRLYRTAFASPQLELWELDDEWPHG